MRLTSVWALEREKEAKALLERILKRHDGNRTRAARELGIERNYLRRLIRRYGLK